MTAIKNALPGLVVAAGGAGLAWLGYRVWAWLPVVIVAVVALAGYLFHRVGRGRLATAPVRGAQLMQWRFLMPLALGAGAAGLLIALAVWFEPVEGTSTETKKLLAASLGALTAFLTAAWIKSGEEAAEQWIATPIKAAFQSVFATRFQSDPEGVPAQALFNDTWQGRGWKTTADRRARAVAVAAGLAG